MIVIENRPSRRTASVPMLYTWLHDQQCFTEFPIFSLRLIVLNGRARQPTILWHFLRHLVARGEERCRGPVWNKPFGTISDEGDRITSDQDWPIFPPAPPQGDDINCLIWQSSYLSAFMQTGWLHCTADSDLSTELPNSCYLKFSRSYLVAKWDKVLKVAAFGLAEGGVDYGQLFGFVRFGALGD